MKRGVNFFAKTAFSLAVTLAFASCNETAEEVDIPVVKANPTLSSVEQITSKSTTTSESFSVSYKEAAELYYRCFESDDSTSWDVIDLDDADGTIEVTFNNLSSTANYTAEFYAANGDEVSATKSVTFTTTNPSIGEVKLLAEESSDTSLTLEVSYSDAATIQYSYYIKADGAASPQEWCEVVCDEESTPVKIVLEDLVASTEYVVELYAQYEECESEVVSKEFTTNDRTLSPQITSLSIVEESLAQTAATIAIGYNSDVTMLNFTYYKSAEAESVTKTFTQFPIMTTGSESMEMPLSSLEVGTDYTFEIYASNGDVVGETLTLDFSTLDIEISEAYSISLSQGTLTYSTSQIVASYNDTNSTYYSKIYYTYYKSSEADTVTKSWTSQTNYIGSYSVTFTLYDLEENTPYIVEAYATSSDGTVRGDTQTLNFTTKENTIIVVDDVISITNFTPTSFGASFDLEILSDKCDGVAFNEYLTTNYASSYFTSDISYGSTTIVTESGHYEVTSYDAPLTANANYTFAYAPVSDITTQSYWGNTITTATQLSEAPATIKFKTEYPQAGQTDIDITISTTEATFASITVDFTRQSSNTNRFYYGIVEASEVSDGDIGSWLDSQSNWFTSNTATPFQKYDSSLYAYVDVETITQTFSSLNANTDYYIFAIAVDSGLVGNISSVSASTSNLTIDDTIEYGVSVDPSMTTAKFNFTFGDKCEKIYYYNNAIGSYSELTESEVVGALNNYILAGNTSYSVDVASATNNELSITKSYLSIGASYVLYTVGVAADGSMTSVKATEYMTTEPDYSSSATVALLMDSYSYNAQYGAAYVSVNVAMSNGAVSYLYKCTELSSVMNQSAESIATSVISQSYSSTNATISNNYFGSETFGLVVIPVDENGDYGKPKIFYFDWTLIE
ncbi:MAG: hypothetical protein SNI51_01055 [Rikenellaceae bacterium]